MGSNQKNLPQKNFYLLTIARSLVTIGNQSQAVAISWFVYSLTKDALSLGMVGLAEFLPALLMAFYAGALVDRKSRKMIYRNAVLLSAMVPIMLFFVIHNLRDHQGGNSTVLFLIFASLGVSGIARAFLSPASAALTGEIIPRGKMVQASAWMTSTWQAAIAIGPAVGGFIYASGGPQTVFIFSAVLQLLAVLLIQKIIPGEAALASGRKESFVHGVKLAWKFMRAEPRLFGAVLLDMLAVFFGGAVALLPIFAERMGTGAIGLGVLRAAPAVGSLLLAAVLVKRPPRRRTGFWLLSSISGFGLCMIMFALSTNFYLSFAALFLSGAFDAVSVVVRGTLLQLLTPDHIKGRISALNSIFINSSNEFGSFESGVTAKFMGPVVATVVGGVMTLLVVLAMAVKFPSLRTVSIQDIEK